MIQKAFGHESMSKTEIKIGTSGLKMAASLFSTQRSVRPLSTITPENNEHVQLAIKEDHRLTVSELESGLGIPRIPRILNENEKKMVAFLGKQ